MDGNKVPFFMAYPYVLDNVTNDGRLADLEYLQELYPREAKRILKKVIKQLDYIDYEGSIIYHEYPDRVGIYRIVLAILLEMEREEEQNQTPLNPEKRMWLEDMIRLVLYQEMYKRRLSNRRDFRF